MLNRVETAIGLLQEEGTAFAPNEVAHPELDPAEQCRLAQLLIERVVIADGGLEIIWRDLGWQKLAGELLPGTIGAKLQEWEQQEVEA